MSTLRPATLLAIGLMLPFAAWGTSAGIDLEPATIDAQLRGEVLPEGISDSLPPACDLVSPDGAGEKVDAQTAACCWYYYMGRWYCVSC